MIRKLLFLTLLTTLFLMVSCNDAKTNSKTSNSKANANANVKTGVAPVADSEIAIIEMEEPAFGTVKLELYSNIAPLQVERFKTLAREGYYNGIAFHRINATVIQAGNSDTKPGKQPNPMKEGDSGKPNVPAEFSDIPYTTGILGAARFGNDVNSANAQFFIMLKPEPQFDKNYTVFGKVIEGMTNVNTIAGVPKNGEKPIDAVRIKSVTIQPK